MKDVAEIRGIKNLELFKGSTIYFLCPGGIVVYVGKTTNLTGRIANHIHRKKFDSVFYLPTPRKRLHKVETWYIRKFDPSLNSPEERARQGEKQVKMINLPAEIHDAIKKKCKASGVTMLRYVSDAIEARLEKLAQQEQDKSARRALGGR